MLERISDRYCRALANSKQVELFDPGCVDHGCEVVDESVEAKLGVPVRQPVAALVIANELEVVRQLGDPATPDGTVEIEFQMVEPVSSLDEARPVPDDGPCDSSAVGCFAVFDLLRLQRRAHQRMEL